jgi:putative membrane protein
VPAPEASSVAQPRGSFGALPIVAYAVVAGDYVVNWLTGGHDGVPAQVTDATGQLWRAADVYESSALSAIYGMLFLAALAALRLADEAPDRK